MLKEKIDAAKDVAKTAERFPWGTSIVVALLTTLIVWSIMRENVNYANRRAEKCEDEKDELINALLIKNNIISKYRDTVYVQQELLREADSTLREGTMRNALKILNK